MRRWAGGGSETVGQLRGRGGFRRRANDREGLVSLFLAPADDERPCLLVRRHAESCLLVGRLRAMMS